ncbi:hypothetical protein TNCV_4984921 [Trichonephila clavipes]|nr:hypothetical protein TNCV_4984921 [Trichonephila clavipes]
MPPHTIIPGVEPVWGAQRSHSASPLHALQTRIRPSWGCRKMRKSSVKTTSFHSATHVLLSSHHRRRRRLWFCVKGRRSKGRLADKPLCCKRHRMVCADTE